MQINFYLRFSSVLAVSKNTNGLLLHFMFSSLWNVKTHDTRFIIENQFSSWSFNLSITFTESHRRLFALWRPLNCKCCVRNTIQATYLILITDPHFRSVSTDTQPRHMRTDDQHKPLLSASHATSLQVLKYHNITESKEVHTKKMAVWNLANLPESINFPTVSGSFG